jgi:glycosyltransferase involved in cell wall biosynthesis
VTITYPTVPMTTAPRFGLRPGQLMAYLNGYRGNYVFNRLFDVVRKDPYKFAHIVQTKREKRNFSYTGIPPETIFDQPLSFVTKDRREAMNYDEARESVRKAYGVSRGRVIGCFGFLSPYKGIEVAINALEHLPKDFTLLVAGGLHPEGIRPHSVMQPYVDTLIAAAEQHSGRVHFLGALDDDDFMKVLAACDAVVLPYAEVGQTSSGPASMALDLQKPVYCSRNYCFRELEKYQKNVISLFEIGNYVELAQKLERDEGNSPERVQARKDYLQKYNAESRSSVYWQAFSALLERAH